ncbi:hypothetical protein HY224_00910 [Candidatus Uhrbacteria bacterium]|nr:hypothetical protein [Candidatus Uhrbacteria bacterium]
MRALIKKQLIGLPVETKSGHELGVLADLELDVDSHLVVNYHVRTSKLLPGFFSKKLIIGRQQVIAMTEEKIVVEDGVLKEEMSLKETIKELTSPPLGVMERTKER